MDPNVPHIIATGLLVFSLVFAVEHSGLLRDASRAKRAIVTGTVVFLAMFILNLLWPYAPA